jgi:uncharacterized protein
MLHLPLGSIAEKGLVLNEQLVPNHLPLLKALSHSDSEAIVFDQPIAVRLRAVRAGDTVQISGEFTTVVNIQCSRCLVPFDLSIDTDFKATAVPDAPSPTAAGTLEEIELSRDDMDVIAYSGDSIDLSEEIAQQIIMSLPFNPLCRPGCRGLCSQCGTNRNRSTCRCSADDTVNPFAALAGLSFPRKKE